MPRRPMIDDVHFNLSFHQPLITAMPRRPMIDDVHFGLAVGYLNFPHFSGVATIVIAIMSD